MERITKGMIAVAHRELETIHELCGGDGAACRYHAYSASGYIAVLRDAGQPLPAWLVRDCTFSKQWAGAAILRASRPKQAVLITPLKSPPEIGGNAGLGSGIFECPITT